MKILVFLLFFVPIVPADGLDLMDCILVLTGASSAEELDESTVTFYHSLSTHPVCVNLWSVARLRSCGLFSPYQAASIDDYRTTSGDILSVSELALLDGFGAKIANALEPFVSFESSARVGESSRAAERSRSDLVLSASARHDAREPPALAWRGKYLYTHGDRWEVGLRRESFDIAIYGRRRLGKVVLGDFNARFGQGLALWSGMSMNGFSGSSSFVKHPSGITPSHSYSSAYSHRGVAMDFNFGRICTSLMAFKDVKAPSGYAANLTYFGRLGQLGLTGVSSGTVSTDFRYCIGSFDLSGEAAYDFTSRTPAALACAVWNPSYGHKVSFIARCYPSDFSGEYASAVRTSTSTSDELGASLGYESPTFVATLDASYRPFRQTQRYKALLKYTTALTEHLSLALRATEKLSPGESLFFRTDLRSDISLSAGDYCSTLRTNCLLCRELARLYYLEVGRVTETLKAYFRAEYFHVDNWDDRIYTYERSAPGNFSSLVHYGRGCSASLFSGFKHSFNAQCQVALYARVAYTGYFRMDTPKPSRFDGTMQIELSF